MRKKILIGSIFAVLLMLSMPTVSNIQAKSTYAENILPKGPLDDMCQGLLDGSREMIDLANEYKEIDSVFFQILAQYCVIMAAIYLAFAFIPCIVSSLNPFNQCNLCSN